MKISVFGLGYVGTVTAGCLARDGHDIIGVDVNPDKVRLVSRGESPIIEPGLSKLLAQAVSAGRLNATTSAAEAIANTDLSLISVGTPPSKTGAPDLGFVFHVLDEIASAIRAKAQNHVVVLRSTVPPGTMARCKEVLDAKTGAACAHLAFNPEFLREGSAIADYDNPPYTVIGTRDQVAETAVREIYRTVPGAVLVVAPELAEMVKYVANAWHATKIGFANEIGRIAKAFDVDGRVVMEIATRDTKLNVSAAYMKPGFAYGGSCLPKDLGALNAIARGRNVSVPLLNALPLSNAAHIDAAVESILQLAPRRVALLGLAFKPGTDDLRESPAVAVAKRLIGEGCEVRIYDRDVHYARLMGTNLAYIRQTLPHFEALLTESPDSALERADTAVLTYNSAEFRDPITRRPDLRVVDLAGVFTDPPQVQEYSGSAW